MTVLSTLQLIYSLPFAIGLVLGIVGQRFYVHSRVAFLNKYRPKADGGPYHAGHISRMWIAGLATAGSLGYVLLSAELAHSESRSLSHRVEQCQAEMTESITSHLSALSQTVTIQERRSQLFQQFNVVETEWIDRLLTPPARLQGVSVSDQRWQDWVYDVTRIHTDRIAEINRQVGRLNERQRQLDRERLDHPLHAPGCQQ